MRLLFLLFLLISTNTFSQSRVVNFYKKGIVLTAYKDTTHKEPIFQLKPGFRFQTRFETSGDLSGTEDWESNFLIRRARLKFDGFILNPDFVYKVELGLSPKDLSSSKDFKEAGGAAKIILDAAMKWKFYKSRNKDHSLTLWVGQTKLPGNNQRLVSSSKLQLVDRSELNSVFNLDRDIGLQLHGKFKAGQVIIKPIFAFSKGEGRNIISNNIGGFNYTGKVEILPMGNFTSYSEGDLKKEIKPKLSFTTSINYNQGSSRQKSTGIFLMNSDGEYLTNDLLTVFADVVFKYRGFSFLGEYGLKKILNTNLSVNDSSLISETGQSYYTGYGISTQAGYLFKHNIELAARYTMLVPDWDKSFVATNEYTLGISKYIVGHKLKVQTDITLIDSSDMRYRLQLEFSF